MTDKQQKPTHYKKLHRYIQILQPKIKRKKKPEVSNKYTVQNVAGFGLYSKFWHGLGWLHARLVRVDFYCVGSISSALWHQYPSDCLLWGMMASLTKSVIALPMVDAACSISSCSTPHFGKEYTVNQQTGQ